MLGFNLGQISGRLIPLAGIILPGVITVSGMYFHNRRREMWYETARIAPRKRPAIAALQLRRRERGAEIQPT
jgi:hypothetical protein